MSTLEVGQVVWVKTTYRGPVALAGGEFAEVDLYAGNDYDEYIQVGAEDVVAEDDILFLLEVCGTAEHAIPAEWYERLEEIEKRVKGGDQ